MAPPGDYCIRSSTAKLLGVRSGTERTGQGNDYELIPTIKMETRHPLEIYLVVSFRRSVIIEEFWRPVVARSVQFSRNFYFFFGKTTPCDKIFQNSVQKVYIATSINVVLGKIPENCQTGNR